MSERFERWNDHSCKVKDNQEGILLSWEDVVKKLNKQQSDLVYLARFIGEFKVDEFKEKLRTLKTLEDKVDEQQATIRSLKKENRALNSIKKFAEDNGINIFYIDTAFRNCWNDNAKLIEENEQLRKHCDCKEEIIKEQERRIIVLENLLTNIGVKWVDDDE